MDDKYILGKIKDISKGLPKFPDGRINYTDSKRAPVINIFLRCGDEILLLRRSTKLKNYGGKWNAISGYLDRIEPIRNKVAEELMEETGIEIRDISSLTVGKPYTVVDEKLGKTWFVCPFIAEFTVKPRIKLNYEHTDYRWIKPRTMKNLNTVIDLDKSYAHCIPKGEKLSS